MRKTSFLKAVSIIACVSILMLSVPGVIAAEKPRAKDDFNRSFHNILVKMISFLPFLNLDSNVDKGDTSSDTTSEDDSGQKIKITGTLRKSVGSKGD